ncbi:bifunctional UDP-3-O-[3-hydroxymyristoyl] N-acetylglucosamine deacetylase/3-hydroxyacyl-ACP dehydratase [Paracrocinitomix mangrovi]|uniref:bifunctional UDP-3-O-[3-hydroxymyristoyl] N-acetylglucosamine deacetylase/3-hydroxyacyl-ACP dehydratase n=1 Tax=Paracrocinitomix mangrovi TaxID=2862509 RepID=UPI001C8D11A3|nr:bifunctional UDP-3-O-[3-hydroxymyristoyl] N-acetylglucosamine deacetylase/3-hydroxyacyl-ACP dehydratase [Paracrocinitomix mangrovi]UKN01546.1 bifunctional UDP-3-O-[3-hydroxymyristoyl] N-acetylglucosamine deacetylase/3-hydroxyacyl-ACP dehydratase [Paracrocinitomix mangrovi]
MAEKQKTLNGPVELTGVGLHTGEQVTLTILPAADNHGYKFQRVDLEGQPIIKADPDNVVSTERGTTLEEKGGRVYTTEHVLAALYALQVDNALIQLNGPEVPIMDGSSKPFVEGIKVVGLVEQEAERDYFVLTENIKWEDPEKGVEFLAIPDNNYRVTVMVDYNSPVLGTQHASMLDIRDFEKEIASCRTFCFLRELEYLADNNLIKGGDLDNAIVLVEREDISQNELNTLAKKLGKENLSVTYEGIGTLNHTALSFENEPARHKLLDIIGDLALVGRPIKAHILAARPGHNGNTRFAKVLKDQIKKQENQGKKFDLEKEPLYDTAAIEKMLPHRYPFLLVDKVMEITEDTIIGVKNVTMNEPQFTGHFPGNPIFPGVLQIEAMAQCGGVFALSKVEDPHLYSTYFMKIDNVKFKNMVRPGDTIVFELKLLSPIRRGLVNMGGVAYVNGKAVMSADMLAQVVKDRTE